ncbi:hypothetical protein SFUMM280S_03495 [Streptomyces fumanus]
MPGPAGQPYDLGRPPVSGPAAAPRARPGAPRRTPGRTARRRAAARRGRRRRPGDRPGAARPPRTAAVRGPAGGRVAAGRRRAGPGGLPAVLDELPAVGGRIAVAWLTLAALAAACDPRYALSAPVLLAGFAAQTALACAGRGALYRRAPRGAAAPPARRPRGRAGRDRAAGGRRRAAPPPVRAAAGGDRGRPRGRHRAAAGAGHRRGGAAGRGAERRPGRPGRPPRRSGYGTRRCCGRWPRRAVRSGNSSSASPPPRAPRWSPGTPAGGPPRTPDDRRGAAKRALDVVVSGALLVLSRTAAAGLRRSVLRVGGGPRRWSPGRSGPGRAAGRPRC